MIVADGDACDLSKDVQESVSINVDKVVACRLGIVCPPKESESSRGCQVTSKGSKEDAASTYLLRGHEFSGLGTVKSFRWQHDLCRLESER